ncbi:MAG: hypothetical protein AAB518_00040 [Patescibacteria group bacterium]
MHVIPAVNAVDRIETERQLRMISGFAHWVHLDVVDGRFAPNVTWGSPDEILNLKNQSPNLKTAHFEVHLMVKNPEEVAAAWAKISDRIIVHVEAMHDRRVILKSARDNGAEAMLAVAPGTPNARLAPHLASFKFFQVLAVPPGKAGQRFDPAAVERIKFLRTRAPNAIIEVDGGINPHTAVSCRDAGAHIFVAASYILGSNDPKEAYEELLRATSH